MRPETFEAFRSWIENYSPPPGRKVMIMTSTERGYFVRKKADEFAESPVSQVTSRYSDWITVLICDMEEIYFSEVAFFHDGGRGRR